MFRFRILTLLLMLLVGTALTAAQGSGGQMCIRAFEDRNANGAQDTNEPRITRGLSATLANAEGVIIASAIMDDSPNAASGTLCFQRLEPGQYTLRVSSAVYTPTTPGEFVAVVAANDVQVLDYGGRVIPNSSPAASSSTDELQLSAGQQRALLARLVVAGIGALIAIVVMALLGAFLYLLVVRPRRAASYPTGGYPPVPPGTGSYGPVQPGTGSYAPPQPGTGSYAPAQPDNRAYTPPPQTAVPDTNQPQPPSLDDYDFSAPTPPPAKPSSMDDDFRFDDSDENNPFKD